MYDIIIDYKEGQIMSTEVYALRIPEELHHVFEPHDDITLPTSIVFDLNKLANYLPLEDLFFLVYEQTICPVFTKFTRMSDVKTILQHPANINWLISVRDQYDSYIRKREDKEKVTGAQVPFTLPDFTESYYLEDKHSNLTLDGMLLTFKPYTENESIGVTEVAKDPIKYVLQVYGKLLKGLGYDNLRKHQISKYLLTFR